MKQPRKMKPARSIGTPARALPDWWEIKSWMRSGRMPRTLLPDATTGITAYADLTALARSMQAQRPCYARQQQRNARQLNERITAANAILAWTEQPWTNPVTFTEVTSTEPTFTEAALTEYTFTESARAMDP